MRNKLLLSFVIIVVFGIGFLGITSFYGIRFSDNLEESFPKTQVIKDLDPILSKGKRAIVFSVTSENRLSADEHLAQLAKKVITEIGLSADTLISNLAYKSDADPEEFIQFVYQNLYLFLDQEAYDSLNQVLNPEFVDRKMQENLRVLVSPEGLMRKNMVVKDPLGLMNIGWKNVLKDFGGMENVNANGFFISTNEHTLFITGTLNYNPDNTQKNKELEEKLNDLKQRFNAQNQEVTLDYFGTFLVANANASQIKADIQRTMTIAIGLIFLLLLYYYRNGLVLVLFLMPGMFGVLFAIWCVWMIQGQISGIALGAGAVVLGIVVDYSFHFFSDFKHNKNAFVTKKHILLPLSVSGATTIMAFWSLRFAHSKVLQDFGLFTSLSLFGALFFVLFLLPIILNQLAKKIKLPQTNKLDLWVEKWNFEGKVNNLGFFFAVVVVTIVLGYFSTQVQFSNNLGDINYYPAALKQRELAHQNIHPDTQKRVQFFVQGKSKEELAKNNFELYARLQQQTKNTKTAQINGLGKFLIPHDVQKDKQQQWIAFWKEHAPYVDSLVQNSALKYGFHSNAFGGFSRWISEAPELVDLYQEVSLNPGLSQFIVSSDTLFGAITSVVIDKTQLQELKSNTAHLNAILVDGEGVMNKLVALVKDDFNYLLLFASILVFVAMLLVYGSLELTLISFLPIAISWVWILGFAALLNIEFNFVNIILVTFIFGLGDDFAIFITDGMLTKYKYGRSVLNQYKTGIILSSISTIIGTGVLFFAQHPAIKSIAAISVLGILTIVVVSLFIQPILFHFFITRRTQEKKPPVTILSIFLSVVGYAIFIIGSLVGVVCGNIIRLLPGKSKEWKKEQLHKMLQIITGFMLDVLFTTTKRKYGFENLNFDKPSVIIANHASFFDILAIARLHPKLVMFVNSWVYNSPLFGSVIRYADYIPIMNNMEDNTKKCQELVSQGYSIMVFPEGKRSVDGKLNRFHKGAFKLAIDLDLDITPIILHGFGYTMPKYDYNLKDSYLSTVVLPRISNSDASFGQGYKERTKNISSYFKKEYAAWAQKLEAVDYQFYPLLFAYKYKGPILEWYFRVKWRFEKNNYEHYYQLFGEKAQKIYDLGCGYGFFSHYLKQRNPNCKVLGFDYDTDKIDVAQNAYLSDEKITFTQANVLEVQPTQADGIIIADTLHYLSAAHQEQVLNQCLQGLNEYGVLLVRDGLLQDSQEHQWTKKSEKWSTQWLKFNKVSGDLHFVPASFFESWAQKNKLSVSFHQQSATSSNTLIVFKRNGF